jgi:hypothetical protein
VSDQVSHVLRLELTIEYPPGSTPKGRMDEDRTNAMDSKDLKTKLSRRLNIPSEWTSYELHELRTSLKNTISAFHPGTLSPGQLWNSQTHLWHAERAVINALGVSSWNSAIGGGAALGRSVVLEDELVLKGVSIASSSYLSGRT